MSYSAETSFLARVTALLKLLGPGVLMATAAVGGSHLVASTQAGAKFGWQLALLILVVNLLKYPFFRAGVSYTISTKQTLQQGYLEMGKRYLAIALCLNTIASVVNAAALLLFAASLLSYFIPFDIAIAVSASVVLALILLILLAGHFEGLDNIAKGIMGVLVMATIAVFIVALSNYTAPMVPAEEQPSPWTLATLGFLVVTMGWMPAPIEISSITSLWLKRQCKGQAVTPKSALFDFNLGYAVTVLLALLFLGLGALILYGSGTELSTSGIGFSHQLISMYSSTIGEWAHLLIAIVAFLCIFGSALTVYDGYARVVAEAIALLFNKDKAARNTLVTPVLLFMAIFSFVIVLFFKSALLAMLGFAMTLAFVTTPMFAWLNHKLVAQTELHPDAAPNKVVKLLSLLGLVYLFGFLLVFVWWKWFS
ncbi:NRAMP family divalent metal transporter [Alteromonas sp. PRIM-21]|uniref:NRAMP family divalent metal transporter n=1 Tax=Alteromonas sp. PRIM-21 TaxID=1454978 RepID=UPI0022B960DE|nr:divalent metal cation transporter [Alteromonas sp. PRIM-21]MCZ8530748.1 divalent metal cation transporter [Alteromonas sp. PRIM-21]